MVMMKVIVPKRSTGLALDHEKLASLSRPSRSPTQALGHSNVVIYFNNPLYSHDALQVPRKTQPEPTLSADTGANNDANPGVRFQDKVPGRGQVQGPIRCERDSVLSLIARYGTIYADGQNGCVAV